VACAGSLAERARAERVATGYVMDPADEEKALRVCVRTCAVECTKPGKKFGFSLSFRF